MFRYGPLIPMAVIIAGFATVGSLVKQAWLFQPQPVALVQTAKVQPARPDATTIALKLPVQDVSKAKAELTKVQPAAPVPTAQGTLAATAVDTNRANLAARSLAEFLSAKADGIDRSKQLDRIDAKVHQATPVLTNSIVVADEIASKAAFVPAAKAIEAAAPHPVANLSSTAKPQAAAESIKLAQAAPANEPAKTTQAPVDAKTQDQPKSMGDQISKGFGDLLRSLSGSEPQPGAPADNGKTPAAISKPAATDVAATPTQAASVLVLSSMRYDPVVTQYGNVVIAGRGTAGRRLELFLDNKAMGGVVVPSTGQWQFEHQQFVAPGDHLARVDQAAADGKPTQSMSYSFNNPATKMAGAELKIVPLEVKAATATPALTKQADTTVAAVSTPQPNAQLNTLAAARPAVIGLAAQKASANKRARLPKRGLGRHSGNRVVVTRGTQEETYGLVHVHVRHGSTVVTVHVPEGIWREFVRPYL